MKLYCPNCNKTYSYEEIYPLPDGVDIAQCESCNDILEIVNSFEEIKL